MKFSWILLSMQEMYKCILAHSRSGIQTFNLWGIYEKLRAMDSLWRRVIDVTSNGGKA